MKRFLSSLLIFVLLVGTNITFLAAEEKIEELVHPEETEVTEKEAGDFSILVEEFISDFLKKYKAESVNKLTDAEANILILEIDKLKSDYFGEVRLEDRPLPRSYVDLTGVIFATLSSKTLGVPHGHASLSVSKDGYTHLEANPGQLSKYYYNRMQIYWNTVSHTTLKARGKSQDTHYKVARNAYNYRGYKYNVLNIGGHNCATLVNTVWKAEGGLEYQAVIAPIDLLTHPGLYAISKY